MKICQTSPIVEDSSIVLLARIYTTGGAVAVPGNFTTLTLTGVHDLEDKRNPIASAIDLTPVSDFVYASLQLDREWTINFDEIGYNFAYVVPVDYVPTGGKVFRFLFRAAVSASFATKFAWNVPTLDDLAG